MNAKLKNVLDAANKYLDDHEAEVFIHSLFTRDRTMLNIYRLRSTYRILKSYYDKAAEKNAKEN